MSISRPPKSRHSLCLSLFPLKKLLNTSLQAKTPPHKPVHLRLHSLNPIHSRIVDLVQLCQFPLALARDLRFKLFDQRRLAFPPCAALVAERSESSAESAEEGEERLAGVGVLALFPCLVLVMDAGYEEVEVGDGGLEGFRPASGGGEGGDWAELAHGWWRFVRYGVVLCDGWLYVRMCRRCCAFRDAGWSFVVLAVVACCVNANRPATTVSVARDVVHK